MYVSQSVLLKCYGFGDGMDGALISKEKKGKIKKNNKVNIMAFIRNDLHFTIKFYTDNVM